MDEANWEIVFSTTDQVEAELIRGLLTTSNIPVIMEAKGFKAMPMIFGHSAVGELRLKVPPDQAELASQLLQARFEMDPESEEK